ncbi:putative oxidoreductase [Enterococcus sp. PF1-24]|uniref:iron-containing alcohol dehydrogenase family protein n=1 Tax=unclassified Enterococcus TaxID=2608891 RepID=UPI002473E119|nr:MULTISPECIES: iron-containing alcohol dehydrogenase family protein [unclassified Enterococcus]MDH6365027.1 putative oxidoreductase [Enterococcus sp. PFB1-1]MDH6402128.1 putative oxidoreductase [Enterococcus sp. PF1-24]
MEQALIVRGAPQEYQCGAGAWQQLPNHLKRRDLKKLLVLHGEKSWAAVKNYFPDLSKFEVDYEYYGGNCTDELAEKFAQLVLTNKYQGIIAVGGGKVSDCGKLAAYLAKVPIIMLPTLSATCAAYTPLSVVYDDHGVMERLAFFPVSNALVLIEPAVILESPVELMVAGIGDTLAKWYEADAIIAQLEIKPIEVKVAEYAAQQCQEVLLRDSEAALASMEKQEISQPFLNVLETNILLAGMVGGFGDEYGRTAGAHSIHDAMTLLPASHQQLHGNKVAYGVFVQLVIEMKWHEIEKLLPFYQKLGLPHSLAAMNMHLTEKEYMAVATRACIEDETIHFMKEEISPEIVKQAMLDLEAFMADKGI